MSPVKKSNVTLGLHTERKISRTLMIVTDQIINQLLELKIVNVYGEFCMLSSVRGSETTGGLT